MADVEDDGTSETDAAGKVGPLGSSAQFPKPAVSALAELSAQLQRERDQLAATFVTYNLVCEKCRYNLRTLSAAGRCPECGTPVKNSIPRAVLADAKWLQRLRRGAVGILSGACFSVVSLGLTVVASNVTDDEILIWLFLAAELIGPTMIFVGGWMLAEPDPAGRSGERGSRSRVWARLLFILGIAGLFLLAAVIGVRVRVHLRYDFWFALLAFLMVLGGLVGLIVELNYLEDVALRLHERKTCDRITFVRPGLYISAVFFSFCQGWWIISDVRGDRSYIGAGIGCFALISLPVLGIFVLAYLRMLAGFAMQLRAQIRTIELQAAQLDAEFDPRSVDVLSGRMSDVVVIPQSLWTKVCCNCGYSLEGAASTGTCPECGRVYDQSEVILHGYARGTHENTSNAKRSRLGWVIVISMLGTAIQLSQMVMFNPGFRRWGLACLGIALIPSLYLLLRRQGTAHPGLVQIRLNPNGCVQYDDLAGPSILRELWRANIWLIPLAISFGLLVLRWRDWIDPIPFWCFFPMALASAPFCWWSSHRFRRATRKIRDGSVADVNAALVEPTLWKNVSSFQLLDLKGGICRFRINADYGFFTFRSGTPIDAEIGSTSGQIIELRRLIGQWIAQSRMGH